MSTKEEDKKNGTWTAENHQTMMEHVLIVLAADQLDPAILESPRVYDTPLPQFDDEVTINGEVYPVYEVNEHGRLTAPAVAKLLAAQALVTASRTADDKRFRKTLAKLLALRSPAMSRAMDNLPGAALAMKSFDIFTVWPFLMQAVILPGANSAMSILHTCVTVRQGGDLSDFNTFATRFRLLMIEFTKSFQDDSLDLAGNRVVPQGYVKIETLFCLLFLRGIADGDESDFFAFIMDKCVSTVTSVHDFGTQGLTPLMQHFVSFKANARAKPLHEPAVAFPAAVLASKKCAKCQTAFTPVKATHVNCLPCSRIVWKQLKDDRKEERKSTKPVAKAHVAAATDQSDLFSMASLSPHLRKLAALELAGQQPAAKVAAVSGLSFAGNPALAKALGSLSDDYQPAALMAKSGMPAVVAGVGLSRQEIIETIEFLNADIPEDPIIVSDVLAAILLLDSDAPFSLSPAHVASLSHLTEGLASQQHVLVGMLHSRKYDLDLSQRALVVSRTPFDSASDASHPLVAKHARLTADYIAAVQRKLRVEFSVAQFAHYRARAVAHCVPAFVTPAPCSIDTILGATTSGTVTTAPSTVDKVVASPAKPPPRTKRKGVVGNPTSKAQVPRLLPTDSISASMLVAQSRLKPEYAPRVNRINRGCKSASTEEWKYDPSHDYGGSASASRPIVGTNDVFELLSEGSEEEGDEEEEENEPTPVPPVQSPSPPTTLVASPESPKSLVAILDTWQDVCSHLGTGTISPDVFTAKVAQSYLDTGATYLMKSSAATLFKVQPCHVSCGGVGTGVVFTQFGYDPRMPVGRRLTFVCADAPDLTSPGYLGATGRAAFLACTDNILHVFVDNHLFMSAAKQANNLYPVSSATFHPHPSVDPLNFMTDVEYTASLQKPTPVLPIGIPREKLVELLSAVDNSAPVAPLKLKKLSPNGIISQPTLAHTAPASSPPLLNSEQRHRVDLAEQLHRFLHFQGYDAVSTAVSMGGFASASPLDAKDIQNLRATRGPDPHYLAGYFNQKPMPPSQTPPASAPGQALSFDIAKLAVPSVNGYTHEVRVVSEFEGYFAVLPARSKSCKDLFEAIHSFIATTYNALSHRVKVAHADAEGVMKAMTAVFGSVGIVLTLSPPGQHAQRIERYTQQLYKGARSTLDCLPYELPSRFDLYLHMNVADMSTLVPNSASWPLSPYERVHNKRRVFHKQHPFLPFGTVCMVKMGDAKRATMAQDSKRHHQSIPKSEVGICLGMHPAYPQSYLFYVESTNKILPRRVAKILSPDTIPFNWPVKVSMSRTLKQFPVDLPVDTSPNEPIQPGPAAPAAFQDNAHKDSLVGYDKVPLAPVPVITIPQPPLPLQPSVPAVPLAAPPAPLPPVMTQPIAVLPTPPAPPAPPPPRAPAPPVLTSAAPPPRRSSRSTSGQAPNKLTYDVKGGASFVSVVDTLDLANVLLPRPLGATAFTAAPEHQCVLCQDPLFTSHKHFKYCADCYKRTAPIAFLAPAVSAGEEDFDSLLLAAATADKDAQALAASLQILETWSDDCDPSALQSAAMLLANVNSAHMEDSVGSAPSSATERCDNAHELSAALLSTVTFLSESTPEARPHGLHMPIREQHEVAYNYAKARPELFPPDKLKAGLDKEMYKMFDGMGVLELVENEAKQVDKNALFVPSMMLTRQKYHPNGEKDVIGCRFAMIGSTTDPAMFGDTSASTADEAYMLCCMSAFQADGVQHGYVKQIDYESFDVCGAFLHIDLISPVMIITRVPKTLDHPYAGRLVIVRKSCYGLRQSNKAFADDFDKTIKSAGFSPTLDPNVYKRVDLSTSPPRRCYVSTHVDDGKATFNHRPYYSNLVDVLEKRYGTLKKGPLTGFTGTTFTKLTNGAFTRNQQGFARRFLDNVGLLGITKEKVPSQYNLFEEDPDSPPCDQKLYRTIIGSLIHLLRTRYDIQKEVVHLSSKSSGPTLADLAKVHIVLKYLSATIAMGPTYHTNQGATLVCYVDCSYGCHVDGRSHAAFSLHIGADNAPFFVSSKKQKDCVAVGSMEGEYVALSSSARKVMEFRYFLGSCDFPQLDPTVIFEDNMSAINLATASAISKKSRHIHIRHHYIRDKVDNKEIKLVHLSTDKMLADFFTKPFGPKKLVEFRDRVFNTSSIPP